MRHIVRVAVVLVWIASALAATADESQWSTNFEKTTALALQKKVPVVLDFTSSSNYPACRMMEYGTLQLQTVVDRLEHYQKVRIDVVKDPDLAERFEIHAVPTFVLLGEDGQEVSRVTGAMGYREFCKWLNSSTSIAAFTAVRSAMFEEKQHKMAEELKASDPTARRKLVATLLEDRLRNENEFQQFAAEHLKVIAKETPSALLDYLDDERLPVRIIVGNLLRQSLGTQFVYDPWAPQVQRLEVIQRWKPHPTAQAQ